MKKQYFLFIGIILVFSALTFYLGIWYSSSNSGSFMGNRAGNMNRTAPFSQGRRGIVENEELIAGTIISKDTESITIKPQNGGSKIIFYSSNLEIEKTVKGSLDDLKNDTTVMIRAQKNSDGSYQAKSVQLRDFIPPVSR